MRLIDADNLLELLQKSQETSQQGLSKDAKFAYATHWYFMEIVKAQPTAFDLDKVIEQLELRQKHFSTFSTDFYKGASAGFEEAIEIVKGGGIDG